MERLIQLIPAAVGVGGLPTAFFALDTSGVIWYSPPEKEEKEERQKKHDRANHENVIGHVPRVPR